MKRQSGLDGSPFPFRLTARELAVKMRCRHNASRYPVPVISIAENVGATVEYAQILSDGSLGRTEGGYIIKVNETLHPYRQRFTIAHELGHIVFEREAQESSSIRRCSTGTFNNRKEEEQFCNYFAACLLLPDNAIAEFTEWKAISIQKLMVKAHELEVSVDALVWRVLEQTPYEGGTLWFRMMGKPTNPKDIKLRLDWGVFPKTERMYLPRYDAVPKRSPIHQALASPHEKLYHNVEVDFGSLRGRRTLLVKAIGQRVLAIVFPEEVNPSTVLSDGSNFPQSRIDIAIDEFGENQDGNGV